MASFLKPMLLTKFSKSTFLSYPNWYVSEKFDGWRLLYQNGKFFTRQGNEILLEPKFYKDLQDIDSDVILDGELWAGYNCVNEVASLNKVQFLIFDIISDKPFKKRIKQIHKLVSPTKRIKIIEHTLVTSDNYSMVEQLLSEVTSREGEGLVMRHSEQIYQPDSRPKDFLKLKKLDSTEVEVVDYFTTPNSNQPEGYISSLVCDYQGRIFKLNWRSFIAPEIGTFITIKFSQFTVNGLPKFPVYVAQRDQRDLKIEKVSKPRKPRKVIEKSYESFEPDVWKAVNYCLQPGESVGVIGSKDTYKVTKPRNNGPLYCNCPSWTYQRMPAVQRTCKHTRLF